MKKILSILWFVGTIVSVLVVENGDGYDRISLAMLLTALTFPSGLLILFGSTYLAQYSTHLAPYLEGSRILIWILFIGVGYFQWFYLLPKLFSWSKNLKTKKNR